MAKTTNIYGRIEPLPKEQTGVSSLTKVEINTELEGGYMDFVQGNTKAVAKVFEEIRKEYEK